MFKRVHVRHRRPQPRERARGLRREPGNQSRPDYRQKQHSKRQHSGHKSSTRKGARKYAYGNIHRPAYEYENIARYHLPDIEQRLGRRHVPARYEREKQRQQPDEHVEKVFEMAISHIKE